MSARWRTALVGLGRIGASYADDPLTARHYRYATHAQILADHPCFEFGAAVDPDIAALATARTRWGFAHAARSIEELLATYQPEMLVLATPPSVRLAAVEPCPGLKAVICEKPLGVTIETAQDLVAFCAARQVLLQVGFWRRCDALMRDFAAGRLETLVGRPQAVQGVYGNGLLNNGSHLVDMLRMFFGEIVAVRALGAPRHPAGLPLAGDFDVPFAATFAQGLTAVLQPLEFQHYREIGLSVWGETGRLEILNEGLVTRLYRRRANRALTHAGEIASDEPEALASTVGDALYRLYDNLAAALQGQEALLSSGASALRTAAAIETVRNAALAGDEASHAIRYGGGSPA